MADKKHEFGGPVEADAASQLEGDFSIVIGGPLFQALRRAHLTGDALELTRRRAVVVAMIVWFRFWGCWPSTEGLGERRRRSAPHFRAATH